MSAPNSRPGSVYSAVHQLQQSLSQYNTFDEKAFLADAQKFRDARFLECGRQLRLAVHVDGQPPWMTVADETITVRELIAKLEAEFEEIFERGSRSDWRAPMAIKYLLDSNKHALSPDVPVGSLLDDREKVYVVASGPPNPKGDTIGSVLNNWGAAVVHTAESARVLSDTDEGAALLLSKEGLHALFSLSRTSGLGTKEAATVAENVSATIAALTRRGDVMCSRLDAGTPIPLCMRVLEHCGVSWLWGVLTHPHVSVVQVGADLLVSVCEATGARARFVSAGGHQLLAPLLANASFPSALCALARTVCALAADAQCVGAGAIDPVQLTAALKKLAASARGAPGEVADAILLALTTLHSLSVGSLGPLPPPVTAACLSSVLL
jgi:hypothetical protein